MAATANRGPHPSEKCFKQHRRGNSINKFSSYLNSRNRKNEPNARNNRNPNVCFICGLEDHWITDCPKQENLEKRVLWNMDKLKPYAYKSTEIDKALENNT